MSEHRRITFWQELGRRNVLRVAAAYAVASFAVIEVVSNVTPGLHLPDWVLSLFIVLLALGFPAAVAFAWVYEITPDGLKRTEEVGKDTSITHRTAHRLNVVLIVLVAVLIGLYGADRFLPARQAAEAGNPAAPQNAAAGISIAVLPFVNLSSDKEQEFFSDGMTEEITSALAKVKGLRVVGRTSAFEFKGQNKDLHAIGLALRAGHLLEGSVRKEGNQIRVTAQLIRADDGTHIWTDNYDRELKSVFAIQDDIAKAIAGALRVPLGLKQGATLVASSAIDPESYQQYLRAKALFRARTNDKPLAEIIGLLEQVVTRDPGYAPAWGLLAQVYAGAPQHDLAIRLGSAEDLRRAADSALPKAEAAARRAIELDPRNADAYAGLALTLQSRGKRLEAEDLYKQALKLDAFNPEVLDLYSSHLAAVGRVKEAVAMLQQLRSLEPLVPVYVAAIARYLLWDGQTEAALVMTKTLPSDYSTRATDLARIYAAMGRYGEAANAILSAPAGRYPPASVETAVRLLRTAPAPVTLQDLPYMGELSFVYLYVGDPERALERVERLVEAGYQPFTSDYLQPSYATARKTERFKALARKSGLVEYWRARGWTGPCRPVGKDDFECS